MVNKNYVSGRSREYRIMNKLKDKGWIVFRTSGSHGVADLIAVDIEMAKIIFIQVKPKSMSNKAKTRIELANFKLNGSFWCNFKVVSLEKELRI